jgi:hypothetical protein
MRQRWSSFKQRSYEGVQNVRFTLLFTASVVAASIGLSACSSGGSQAVPGGSQQTASMAKSGGPHIAVVGGQPQASCPSQYFECVTISKKSPAQVFVCVTSSGSCDPNGVWMWSSQVQVAKSGEPYKKITETISPNPGNPTYITISEKKKVKNSHGHYKYQDAIEGCNSSSQCISGDIGIATD